MKRGALEEIILGIDGTCSSLASKTTGQNLVVYFGQVEREAVVSDTKPEIVEAKTDVIRGRPGRRSPEPARELCLCGHRASAHAANRYACQAPGNRKGFCACMRFLGRSSPIGKRLRAVDRAKTVTEPKSTN